MSHIIVPDTEAYVESLFPQKNELLAEMELFAKQNKIPILEPPAARFLELLVRIKNPAVFLEIGTAIGYSTIIAASAMKNPGRVYSIEKSKDNLKLAAEYIKRSGYEDRIELLEGDAALRLREFNRECDIIFLDADKEDYDELCGLSFPLLSPDGILLIDNLLWHGYAGGSTVPPSYINSTNIIREFNQKLCSMPGYSFTLLTVGDGLGLVMRKG